MTNSLRQQKLDKRKWLDSEKAGQDLSGKMDYCNTCVYQSYICMANPIQREQSTLCAKAFNKMYRNKISGGAKNMKMNDLNLVSITKNSINFNESVTENYSLDTYIQASIRSTDKEIIIVFSRESIYGNTHKVRKHYSNRTGKCWVSIKGDAFLELDKLLNLSKSVCKFIPKVHTVDQDSIYIILTRY